MLHLRSFVLEKNSWDQARIPFRHTLLEALFPHRDVAIVRASTHPDRQQATVDALANMHRWQLDFASGAKKHGDFFATRRGQPRISAFFWDTCEKAIAYGGNLVTDSEAIHHIPDLKVLVVHDGEHATGDCHAKLSPQLSALLEADERCTVTDTERRALQFRLATLQGDRGYLAKGTAIVQHPGGPDLPYDIIIPLSAFKSFQPDLGPHTWDAHIAVVSWSSPRPTRLSYTILQWFSRETIDADVWPRTQHIIARLRAAGESPDKAIEFFRLAHPDRDQTDGLLFDILRSDLHGRLTHHPYVVSRITRMLRRKWLHAALGGALNWTGLQAMPDDTLPDAVISTRHLPEGDTIATRYPVRSWADLKLWQNIHSVPSHPDTSVLSLFAQHPAASAEWTKDAPNLSQHHGVVWMSHATAAQVGGDFDGDYFLFAPAADFPAMAAEIESWAGRMPPEVVKVKHRLASPITDQDMARVAMDNTDNMVGLITYFIAQANAAGRLDLIQLLAPRLQIAVDKFKYNLDHDNDLIDDASRQLLTVPWLDDKNDPRVFLKRPISVADGHLDTISHLAHRVNALWKAPSLTARPLHEFAGLFTRTQAHRQAALTLSARYANLIRRALNTGDRRAFSPVFAALDDWAASRQDPDNWAAALWHAVHRKGANGTGSLAFNAFPEQIMAALQNATTLTQVEGPVLSLFAQHPAASAEWTKGPTPSPS